VLCWIGIGCVLFGIFLKNLSKGSLYPVRDPRLKNSLHLVN
jgi:hypothetical protein